MLVYKWQSRTFILLLFARDLNVMLHMCDKNIKRLGKIIEDNKSDDEGSSFSMVKTKKHLSREVKL